MASLGWGQAPGFDPSPHFTTVGLLLSSPPLPHWTAALGGGEQVLGEVPQVTEQTAPSPPQPLGWRETRFWFLRLHEHTEVHVLP